MDWLGGVGRDLSYWRDQLVRAIRRLKPAPVLIRVILMIGIIGAGLLSAPDPALAVQAIPAVAIAALLTALAPGSFLPTFTILMAVFGAILQTAGTAPMSPVRLLALAGLLYVIHTSAALGAVLPLDAMVSPAVLARWYTRAGLVMFGTAAVGVAVSEVPGLVGQQPGYLLVLLAGLALGLAVTGMLIRLLRRE